jgi:hypothetical protein
MIDLHDLAAERSLAYHREIALRMVRDPDILQKARDRVRDWMTQTPERPFVQRWSRILQGTTDSVAAFIVDRSEFAQEMRQSTPFAGVLKPRERWRIWRETAGIFAARQ